MLKPCDNDDACQWRHEAPDSDMTMEADKENAVPSREEGSTGNDTYTLAELLQSVDGMERSVPAAACACNVRRLAHKTRC